jgi:cancer susceptibility candidate protein 1
VRQHLERRNQELEELYLLEGCFSEAEKLKRDTRSLSQVRLTSSSELLLS